MPSELQMRFLFFQLLLDLLVLVEEERVAAVVTLLDIRHGPTALDLDLQEILLAAGRERLVVLTKADKVGRGKRAAMQRKVQQQLGLPSPPMTVSVQTGEGRRELMAGISQAVAGWRTEHQRGD